MVLTSEQISDHKNILIADTHARGNGFSENEIREVANLYKCKIERILSNLNLNGWNIFLASEICQLPSYNNILMGLSEDNEYLRKELTDMVWFNKEFDLNLKLGWAIEGKNDVGEPFFDRRFISLFGNLLSFIYTVPGRTFDPKKIRAPPYICCDKNSRILISADENVMDKMQKARELGFENIFNSYKNFLNAICRLYSKVVEPISNGTVEEKLQLIINRCLS